MTEKTRTIDAGSCRITLPATADALWTYLADRCENDLAFAAPTFNIDSVPVIAAISDITPVCGPVELPHGVIEHRYIGPLVADAALSLEIIFRVCPASPVVRFRYVLHSTRPTKLTKPDGRDALEYLAVSLRQMPAAAEMRFSTFNQLAYSYMPRELPLTDTDFQNQAAVMGPMLLGDNGREAMLVAYEHGSTYPDAYLNFHLGPDRNVALRAVKGNYYSGRPLGPDAPYETIWLQCAATQGTVDALAEAYRTFVLKYQTPNLASRRPYIYYNTWGRQNLAPDRPNNSSLDTMTETEILKEINVAGKMGIEVFVIDAGWFDSSGLWDASKERFPNGLSPIKAALDARGMQLGLWQSTQVGTSTEMYREHRDCVMSWCGDEIGIWSVWGAEPGRHMCLVSRYADTLAERTIEMIREYGVTYFKWDAFGHYGCDLPGHLHGDENTSVEDRAQCYTFEFDKLMQQVADRICAACPDAIVDFDVTEPLRNFGLGFLASGKYFLINDGPYGGVYDFAPGTGPGCVFGNPGPARGWNCRTPLAFDKWIPSICMLVHYRPDEPGESQILNVASLILGHNGIWGDICSVSDAGVKRISRLLGLYKQVRDDITESSAVITGRPADSPEIYEKVSAAGRGVVCIFASMTGSYRYVTRHTVQSPLPATDGTTVTLDDTGHAVIDCTFSAAGAKVVFFGAEES